LDFEGYLREQAATEPAPGEAELAARLAAGDTTPQEQAAAEPEAPVVEEAAPAEAEQHRDEQGRFAAKDDVVEQRLKEKDRVIGSMAQELGDLRKMVEERIPAQPEQQYDLSGAAAAILENPGLAPQAAMLALKQGDDLAYEQVLRRTSGRQHDPVQQACHRHEPGHPACAARPDQSQFTTMLMKLSSRPLRSRRRSNGSRTSTFPRVTTLAASATSAARTLSVATSTPARTSSSTTSAASSRPARPSRCPRPRPATPSVSPAAIGATTAAPLRRAATS
jgi:hypothetical protein